MKCQFKDSLSLTHNLLIFSALKGSKVIATIPSSWKTCLSFINSFAMTENYVILYLIYMHYFSQTNLSYFEFR